MAERFDKEGRPIMTAKNVDNSGLTYTDFRGNKATWRKPSAKDETPEAQYKEEKAMDEKVGRQR